MQPRIPRQSAHEQGTDRAGGDAGLSGELAAVVAGARRRAVRDGDRQVDTAHLLHSLLESDPDVRAVTGDAPQIARLLGYLVQRSIGYGLRWQNSVEDSGPIAVVRDAEPNDAEPNDAEPNDAEPNDAEPNDAEPNDAEPNDAEPNDAEPNDAEPNDAEPNDAEPNDAEPNDAEPNGAEPTGPVPTGVDPREAEGWSPLAAVAMQYAMTRAVLRGEDRADGTDLLAAIVGDPQSRAVEVLGRAGVDVPGLLKRIDSRTGEYAAEGGSP